MSKRVTGGYPVQAILAVFLPPLGLNMAPKVEAGKHYEQLSGTKLKFESPMSVVSIVITLRILAWPATCQHVL